MRSDILQFYFEIATHILKNVMSCYKRQINVNVKFRWYVNFAYELKTELMYTMMKSKRQNNFSLFQTV